MNKPQESYVINGHKYVLEKAPAPEKQTHWFLYEGGEYGNQLFDRRDTHVISVERALVILNAFANTDIPLHEAEYALRNFK